jgi:hypothetical protein
MIFVPFLSFSIPLYSECWVFEMLPCQWGRGGNIMYMFSSLCLLGKDGCVSPSSSSLLVFSIKKEADLFIMTDHIEYISKTPLGIPKKRKNYF